MKFAKRVGFILLFFSCFGAVSTYISSAEYGSVRGWLDLDKGGFLVLPFYMEGKISVSVEIGEGFIGRVALFERESYEKWVLTGEMNPVFVKPVIGGFTLQLSYPWGIYVIVLFNDSGKDFEDISIQYRSSGLPKDLFSSLILLAGIGSTLIAFSRLFE